MFRAHGRSIRHPHSTFNIWIVGLFFSFSLLICQQLFLVEYISGPGSKEPATQTLQGGELMFAPKHFFFFTEICKTEAIEPRTNSPGDIIVGITLDMCAYSESK